MFFGVIRVLKILHWRILQEPFIICRIIVFKFLIFRCFFGLNVIQRLLLAVARDAESPQESRLFQPIALLNVIQALAHAQNARNIIIRFVRVNHGQIQAQHGVCAGNAHPFFSHLSHVVTVTCHRFVNEGHLQFAHRNVVMLRHYLADAGMFGHDDTLKVVVFQTFFDFASAALGIR